MRYEIVCPVCLASQIIQEDADLECYDCGARLYVDGAEPVYPEDLEEMRYDTHPDMARRFHG